MKLFVIAALLNRAQAATHMSLRAVSLRRHQHTDSPLHGKPGCECIGISHIKGSIVLTRGSIYTESGTVDNYPPDLGTYCKAWDDGLYPGRCQKPDEQPGLGKGWCAEKWCYVDPCTCSGVEVKPKITRWMRTTSMRGLPIYYSYSACGGDDRWTNDENPDACIIEKSEEGCSKKSDCSWTGTQCLGWELAGLCEHKDSMWREEWGDKRCPCIGIAGYNGTMKVTLNDGREKDFPLDTGSECKAWDTRGNNPECSGNNPPAHCAQPWCFVDPCQCSLDVPPTRSSHLPDARFKNRPVYYSYSTCGAKKEAAGDAVPVPADLCKSSSGKTNTDKLPKPALSKPAGSNETNETKSKPAGNETKKAEPAWHDKKEYGKGVYPMHNADSKEGMKDGKNGYDDVAKAVEEQRKAGDDIRMP